MHFITILSHVTSPLYSFQHNYSARMLSTWRAYFCVGKALILFFRVRTQTVFPVSYSTTIRTAFKIVSGSFWPAKSNRIIHLSIAPPVVASLAKTSRFSKFHPDYFTTSLPTIRESVKKVSRPIWCAESNSTIYFIIGLLVVAMLAKHLQFSDFQNSGPTSSSTCLPSSTYHQNSVEWFFWTFLTLWIRL